MSAPAGDDRLLERLVQASGSGPDANAIAAASSGPRGASEAARLARDPEAVLLLRVLAREGARKRRVVWIGTGLAACLLAGIVVVLGRSGSSERMDPLGTRLQAAVRALRGHDSGRFGDFALARAEELEATTGVMRGGAAWLAPRGTILQPPQELHWRRPGGMGRVEVTVRGPGVSWRQIIDGDVAPAPPLRSGRYVVTLRLLDGLAGQTVRRSFVVADDARRRAYLEARAVWEAQADPDLHDLIEAHYAFMQGLRERALDASRRAERKGGEASALVRPLLRHLER